jgi:hypothetical protein
MRHDAHGRVIREGGQHHSSQVPGKTVLRMATIRAWRGAGPQPGGDLRHGPAQLVQTQVAILSDGVPTQTSAMSASAIASAEVED